MGTLNLNRVTAATTISSATENANQTAIETVLNGAVDSANLSPTKIIQGSQQFKQDGATNNQVYAYDGMVDNRWEPTSLTTLLALVGGVMLGAVQYNPTTEANVSTTSTTMSDVDATNLVLTVTVPSNGKLLVQFSAVVGLNAQYSFWGLRETTTEVASIKISTTGTGSRVTAPLLVTGLTAGAHTYKWGIKTVQAGVGASVSYGTKVTPDTSTPGPATMTFWTVI